MRDENEIDKIRESIILKKKKISNTFIFLLLDSFHKKIEEKLIPYLNEISNNKINYYGIDKLEDSTLKYDDRTQVKIEEMEQSDNKNEQGDESKT